MEDSSLPEYRSLVLERNTRRRLLNYIQLLQNYPGTLNHSLSHSLTHSLTQSLTHSLSHSLTHSHTHSLTHSATHSLTHSHTHSLSHSLTHWKALVLSLSFSGVLGKLLVDFTLCKYLSSWCTVLHSTVYIVQCILYLKVLDTLYSIYIISVWLLVCAIITHKPLDQYDPYFYWRTR